MFELAAGVLLSAAAVYYVLRPVLRPAPAPGSADAGADAGDDPEDDLSPRAQALRALREIEFDRATGKLSDADYDALHAKYTTLALEALRAEEAASAPREPARAAPGGAPTSGAAAPAAQSVCPAHGAPAEPGASFCPACGRRLGPAAAYCARCGTTLESGARFCSRCGARVAA